MERCDFASVAKIIRDDLLDGNFDNQTDFAETLFSSYLEENDVLFDMGLLNKWLNGLARLSPAIGQFYRRDAKNREALAITLEDAIIPCLSDSAMVSQKIYDLLIHDLSISERKKQELCRRYPCHTDAEEAAFITDVLIFGMTRPFQAHDIRKSNSAATTLSPIVRDYILGNEVPAPCAHFCGRDQELKELHEALIRHRVLFLEGVAGIGKSEIAKAYAREHKKEYTNSIYIMYSGDLRRDITDMYFTDDLPSDTDEARFFRHDRFLRTLKEDTLLIIDNFDVRSIKERFLIFLQHYRCRIILTTRNHWPGQQILRIERIADDEALFQMVARFYPEAEKKRSFILKFMMLLQYHTLILELAARLFGRGMMTPEVVAGMFCIHGTKIGSKDKIRIVKDGKARKDTFEDHIHALFGLYNLSETQQDILRCMVLVPAAGIPMRLLGFWMGFKDLNDVNDLIDLGLLKQLPGGRVALQNTLRPVCRSELETSVSRCQMLLEPLRFTCQLHGVDVPDYKLIYQIVDCTMKYAQKDDMPYYLLLLEDTFQYLEKYQYKTGMQKILYELERRIKHGTDRDRALLLDCKAQMTDDPQESIKLMKQALTMLPEINKDNALLASNLNANLGGTYRMLHEYPLAKEHMETAMRIMEQFGITGYHDSFSQIINYAILLGDMGEPEKGLIGLEKVERLIRDANPHSYDHGMLLQAKGTLQLSIGDMVNALSNLRNALYCFSKAFEGDEVLTAEKRKELEGLLQMVGLPQDTAQELLTGK